MKFWLVKGDPDEGGARQWGKVGTVGRYRLKKGTPDWSVGDAVFLWEPAPRSRLSGIARIHSVPDGRAPLFELERLTPLLPTPIVTSLLRDDVVLADADFLRQGVPGNLFALDPLQARRLARLVTRWNHVGRDIFREWFGSEVIAQKAELDDVLDGEKPAAIVVVNDLLVRTVLARWARDQWRGGVAVVEVEDGEEGWERIRESKPHLVIASVLLTGLSGLEIAQKVRDHDTLAHTKLVLYHDGPDHLAQHYRADAIIKPPLRKIDLEQHVATLIDA